LSKKYLSFILNIAETQTAIGKIEKAKIYHGSRSQFGTVSESKLGSTDPGLIGRGFYGASDPDYSRAYGKYLYEYEATGKLFEFGPDGDSLLVQYLDYQEHGDKYSGIVPISVMRRIHEAAHGDFAIAAEVFPKEMQKLGYDGAFRVLPGGAVEVALYKVEGKTVTPIEYESAVYQAGVQNELRKMATDGAKIAVDQVLGDAAADVFSQANLDAIKWSESRSAELVSLIDKTTREGIKDLVAKAEREGWSNQQLAQELRDRYEFSAYRAEMIARTETAMADVQGSLKGWKDSGVVDRKEFLAAPQCCALCQTYNHKIVDIDDRFPFGDPPVHPNCRCDILPVLSDNEV